MWRSEIMKEVFISYKSEEYDEALWIKTVLETNGVSCWMAPACIPGGSNYASEIPMAIKNCKVFLLILSEKAQKSKWIPKELDQAINAEKVIMPFMLENCDLTADFNFYLTNVQRYDAYNNKVKTAERMVREIKEILKISKDSEAGESGEVEIPAPKEKKEIFKAEKTKKEKVKKEKVKKEKVKKPKTDSKKKALKVLGIIAAVIALITIIAVIKSVTNTFEIVGESFQKDAYSASFEDKEFTETDLANFYKFNSLSSLSFKNCNFKTDDISGVLSYDIYNLEIINCNITDKQFKSLDFESVEMLTELNISGNKGITDISTLTYLADKITSLNISDTSVKNLDILKNFTKLKSFEGDNLGLTDLKFLTNAIYLEKLSASGNKLTNLTGMENITLLNYVNLSSNDLTDISGLSKSATNLKKIYLSNNKLTDLSALSKCESITYFSADNNQLTTLAPLSKSVGMTSVSASGNQLTSLAGLLECNSISSLHLSSNNLENITIPASIFDESAYSISVSLSDNNITSISLPKEINYDTLDLSLNQIKDFSFLSGLEGKKVSFDYPENISKSLLESFSFSEYTIYGCPLDQRVKVEEALYSVKFFDNVVDGAINELKEAA